MARNPRTLTGKVAAVTGGARGIGRATAEAMAREGIKVGIGDLDGDLARSCAQEIGNGARGYDLNVTSRDSFVAFLDAVEADLGPLDVIVNNAGIMQLGEFHAESDLVTVRQFEINFHGVATGTKLALERMRPRRRGHIINIASSAGKVSPPGGATYAASKHAVVGLTEAVAAENAALGIDCSIVMPGVVNTELAAGLAKGRGVKISEPSDVADAIVATLKSPRLDVYVPRSIGGINRLLGLLPRSFGDALGRALKVDRILWAADSAQRSGYESRAARSESGVDDRDGSGGQ
ncbi:MAG: SDR family oxidoreductase [Solirubrobacterales bacterium]|nr:SDR family oxidoreductase [Solirubrobacterales bacterium]